MAARATGSGPPEPRTCSVYSADLPSRSDVRGAYAVDVAPGRRRPRLQASETSPLVLTEHDPDRVAFASMGKRVLSTESPTRPLDRSSREHWTGPGAVTFIGGTSATRADSVAAIIERQPSPLIMWTTSPDLLHRTIGARRNVGTVHVHDPCGLTKLGSVG